MLCIDYEEPTHDWFYFATPQPMWKHAKRKRQIGKSQKTQEHRVAVEQLLGEVVLLLF